MPTKSYAYSTGNVRAKETALLKKQDLEQLIALKTTEAATAFLREKGFSGDTGDVSEMLKAETLKLWDYIRSIAPDFSVFTAFIIPNDYHNLKAVLKGTLKKCEYGHLLLEPTCVSTEVLKNAVEKKDFSLLPDYMKDAAARAYDALVKMGDAQLSDGILDASCMEAQLSLSEKSGIPLLKKIIGAGVFFDNFKTAIRAARAKKDADFLEACLLGDSVTDKNELKKAALLGADEVLALLETKKSYDGDKAVDAYKKSPLEFERFAENYGMKVAIGAKYMVIGAEPLIGYLVARLTEIKAVRIITNGIATAESEDEIRGMLRELYG